MQPVSEPGRLEAQTLAAEAPEALQAWIEALRSDGASRVDPLRFRFLEAMARRMAAQTEPVRGLLHGKLEAALGEYAQRVADARQGAAGDTAGRVMPIPVRPRAAASVAPLARLNQSILAARAELAASEPDEPGGPDELSSVRRFRRTWTSIRIQDQVDEAVARRPANAGPLNSHALVLQSLDLMRELSPRYLERFLAHVEALQWLELAAEKAPDAPGKTPKGERRKVRKA